MDSALHSEMTEGEGRSLLCRINEFRGRGREAVREERAGGSRAVWERSRAFRVGGGEAVKRARRGGGMEVDERSREVRGRVVRVWMSWGVRDEQSVPHREREVREGNEGRAEMREGR